MEMQNWLIYQRINHFSSELKDLVLAEANLRQQEAALHVKLKQASSAAEIPEDIFLADHLTFGCKSGFLLYRVSAPPLQSYWMQRSHEF